MIGPFLVAILFILTLASDRAVLNGNDVFPILVVSTKKRYSSFLKKVFVFQKICFKVKVLKTFETLKETRNSLTIQPLNFEEKMIAQTQKMFRKIPVNARATMCVILLS